MGIAYFLLMSALTVGKWFVNVLFLNFCFIKRSLVMNGGASEC